MYMCMYLLLRKRLSRSILRTLSTESNVIMLFSRATKYTVKMSLLVSHVSWQERLGHRELHFPNVTPKHERQRHQESHKLPHEEEPEPAGAPTEGNGALAPADPPSCLGTAPTTLP